MDKENSIKPFQVMDILARCKEMEAQGRDIIHMEIGEPDFATPQPIIDAGVRALEEHLTHYTSALGLYDLRKCISEYYLSKFSVEVPHQQVVITPGASGALQLILSYVLRSKGKLIVCDPTYPCNINVAKLLGSEVIAVSVDQSSDYQLNVELLERNWGDNIAAVLVASPSNPTGTVCKKESLLEMADFLATKNSFLIVDEIYQGLNYDIQSQTVAGQRNNIFVLNSFSKFFGMTGWRIGWLSSPVDHVERLDAIAQNTYLATSTIAQHAAIAAFSEQTFTILKERRKIFRQRRDLICEALVTLGIKVPVIPQGAFYVYADISSVSDDSFSFCKSLLENEGVAITPGCDFGIYNANKYVRFAYTTSEKKIEEGMRRIKRLIL